jgi:2-dehydro-3-deoxygluconokinase
LTRKPKIAAIGECMIELSGSAQFGSSMHLSFGGDTLNTAVYATMLGASVSYVTALGDDIYSQAMLREWERLGIGTERVARLKGGLPGLYLINNNARGERFFHYWREQAAARRLLTDPDAACVLSGFDGFDTLYLTGITLSILDTDSLDRLEVILQKEKKAGVQIVFDINYRPRGWPAPDEARKCFERFQPLFDTVLPSMEDEQGLYGESVDVPHIIERYRSGGTSEIIVKNGSRPTTVYWNGEVVTVAPEYLEQPVDTTAAGDAFNGAYIAARLQRVPPPRAVRIGNLCASGVIRHQGAIVPPAAVQKACEDLEKYLLSRSQTKPIT